MARSRLNDLIDLAKETSSVKRRELLREVTDLFFGQPSPSNQPQMELFDSVLTQLASEMEEAVRAELAHRFAAASVAPGRLIFTLANATIAVAEPVLARSKVLCVGVLF